MRIVIACLMVLGLLGGSAAVTLSAAAADSSYSVAAEQQPPGQIQVDIETDGEWYANPVWIGIGVVALLVLIAIIAMASRGGTTVIKD